jgi:hypothetical protein
MQSRCLRVVMFVSITLMLVTPALAADESAAPGAAPSGTQFCVYLDGRTDTPETGPLPCNTSRRYMLGTSGFGSSRVPADSEFSTSGPKSHLAAPPASGIDSTEGSAPLEGTLASPPAPDSHFDRNTDIQAP